MFAFTGGWSLSNGGVTYTFKNGHSVTGSGSLSKGGSVSISYKIPLGRKRRSVEDPEMLKALMKSNLETSTPSSPKPLSFKSEKQIEQEDEEAPEELPTSQNGMALEDQEEDQDNDNCDDCLEVQQLKVNDYKVENKTLASNDFVMVVKLIEENMSAAKFAARIKFKVMEIVKSPIDSVTAGQTFTIKAKLAACPCLSLLDPGLYVVTGLMNEENKLVLSNVLMEFEN